MSELPHKVERRGLKGVLTVLFDCPACGVDLHAPLADAGKPDQCPQCQTRFTTPGVEQRAIIEQQVSDAKKQREEEMKRSVEAARERERERESAMLRDAVAEPAFIPPVYEPAAEEESKAPKPTQIVDAQALRVFGGALATIGFIVAVFFALFYDTSVSSSGGSIGAFSLPDRVVNLDRANSRLAGVVFGSALMLAGLVNFGIAIATEILGKLAITLHAHEKSGGA